MSCVMDGLNTRGLVTKVTSSVRVKASQFEAVTIHRSVLLTTYFFGYCVLASTRKIDFGPTVD